MEGGRTVMDDDVDRHAPNPNRVTQPFDEIGKSSGSGEQAAKERYYWSKIRQALRAGNMSGLFQTMNRVYAEWPDGFMVLEDRIGKTFIAGCIALGDPAPLDKE